MVMRVGLIYGNFSGEDFAGEFTVVRHFSMFFECSEKTVKNFFH